MKSPPTIQDNSLLSRRLGVFDVVGIIVGIIIGSAIYKTPSSIAGLLGSTNWIMFAWILGGALSFVGGLCYAELASTYPREGGDYYFLHHTYGRWAGFLYAWGRLWVIHSGNIAMMAYIAGEYAEQLVAFPYARAIYALSAVIIFTGINCLGLRKGKWTQNTLAVLQIVGLALVILVAFFVAPPAEPVPSHAEPATGITLGAFFLACIFVQLTFGGWSDCAFVAAEVRRPEKNILRALLIGLALVTGIYLLINAAVLRAFGPRGLSETNGFMSVLMEENLGTIGGRVMAIIVVICALASVNGMVLVGGRIYHAFGRHHTLFRFLGSWKEGASVPLAAFILQGVISCGLILSGKFEDLVIYTSAAHWLFMAMVGASLIILRFREPQVERPYRVPLFPILPIVYIAVCCMLIYSSFNYGNAIAPYGAWIGFGLVAAGLPVYWISRQFNKRISN